MGEASGTTDEGDTESIRLWLGSVFGSGIFINTLCAAACVLLTGRDLVTVDPFVFMRDIGFRFLGVSMLLFFGRLGYVTATMAVAMMGTYLLYVAVIIKYKQAPSEDPLASDRSTVVELRAGVGQSRPAVAPEVGSSASDVVGGIVNSEHRTSYARPSRPSVTDGACGSETGGRTGICRLPRPRVSMVAVALEGDPGNESILQASMDREKRCHLHEASLMERLKYHTFWDRRGGLSEMFMFFIAFPFRPFFALTMATEQMDPTLCVLLPFGMCIFIPYANPFSNLYEEGPLWLVRFSWLAGGSLTVFAYTKRVQVSRGRSLVIWYHLATFLTAILWCALAANEVVEAVKTLGFMLDLSKGFMGITLLAWGNSLDAFLATVGMVRAGEFRIAVTGVYAGSMFNALFGTGANLLIMAIWRSDHKAPFVMSACPWVILIGLLGVLGGTLLHVKINDWRMLPRLGWWLLCAYFSIVPLGVVVQYALGSNDL